MLGATLGAKDYLGRVCDEIRRLDTAQLEALSGLIEDAYHAGRFVFICGNGGSGANASHLCEDLAKCTLRDFEDQKRLKVLSLTDNTAGIMAGPDIDGALVGGASIDVDEFPKLCALAAGGPLP